MDLGAVAHLSAIGGRYAFMHCFDGFRTSHEMQRIEALDYDDLAKLVDYDQLAAFRKNGLNPEHPSTRGTTVNSGRVLPVQGGRQREDRHDPRRGPALHG